jgi:hypothetical protein
LAVIWVTWRQYRGEAAVAALAVGLLGAFLLITGIQMQAAIQASSHASEAMQVSGFMQSYLNLGMLTKYVLMLLPALLGMFVGAPLLAREMDQRTHLFAWAQSITRGRWFFYKVTLVSGGTLVGAAVLSVLASWWNSPLAGMFDAGRWIFFDAIGVVPLGYALFALALGVSLGTILGRTIPAMFITVVLFAAVRIGFTLLRPWYLPPAVKEIAFYQTVPQGALPLNLHWVDATNHAVSADRMSQLLQQGFHDQGAQLAGAAAPGIGLPKPPAAESITLAHQVDQYMRAHGFHYLAVFQPDDRFWAFQWIEAGIFFALALVLFAVTAWWLQTRLR